MRLEDYPLALSSTQVAEILGVSRTHVWRLVQDGTLPSFKIGRLDRIPRSAIETLLASGGGAGPQAGTAPPETQEGVVVASQGEEQGDESGNPPEEEEGADVEA